MKIKTKGIPAGSWLAFHRDNPGLDKPALSTGSPDELTPNQLADREASNAAHRALQTQGEDNLRREHGWKLLAATCGMIGRTKGEIDEDVSVMSPALVRRWSEGWKVGCYDEQVDVPEAPAEEQRLWLAGLAAGASALNILQGEEGARRGKAPQAAKVEEGVIKAKGEPRKAKQVTDPAEMEAIWKSYRGNGGTMTYDEIEFVEAFNLKWANGMTAYRICKRYDKILSQQKIAA